MKTEDVESLLWQVLDDMGRHGTCVHPETKNRLMEFYKENLVGNGQNLPSALGEEETPSKWGLDKNPRMDFIRHAVRLLGLEHQCALGMRPWTGLYLDVTEALNNIPGERDHTLDLAVASLKKLRERLE